MCNNNGHCRKFDAGTMCPSYRATQDEAHLTRGRANTLRLALSGQLDPDARSAQGGARPVRLLQGLQARMPDRRRHGADEDRVHRALQGEARLHAARPRDRLPAALRALGRCACAACRTLLSLDLRGRRSASPPSASCRSGAATPYRDSVRSAGRATWCCSSIPSTASSSRRTRAPRSGAAGRRHTGAYRAGSGRCAAAGPSSPPAWWTRRARSARRCWSARALRRARHADRRARASCLFTLRDEFAVLLGVDASWRGSALLFEEFLAARCRRPAQAQAAARSEVLLHGHCHQKAFDAMPAVQKVLRLIPGLRGRGDRVELLRHGGQLRLRGRALRRLDEDGRAGAAAGGAQAPAMR